MNRNERIRNLLPMLLHVGKREKVEFDWRPPDDPTPLNDLGLFPDLSAVVEHTLNDEAKYVAYSHIAQLAENLADEGLYKYLIERLDIETKPSAIADILRPMDTWDETNPTIAADPTPFVRFLTHKDRDIRCFSVRLIGRGTTPASENLLLEYIEQEKDEGPVVYALEGLRKSGTEKCLPTLKQWAFARTPSAQGAALITMHRIFGHSQAHFYLEALEDKRFKNKWVALMPAMKYAGENAIDPVIRRVNAILRNKARVPYNTPLEGIDPSPSTELTKAVFFLQQYLLVHPQVKKCFEYLLKNWQFVWSHEKTKIISECPYFRTQFPRPLGR